MKIIVREVPQYIIESGIGESDGPVFSQTPRFTQLTEQHLALRRAFQSCGVTVIVAPLVKKSYAPFVEDDLFPVPAGDRYRLLVLRPFGDRTLVQTIQEYIKVESIVYSKHAMIEGGDIIRVGKLIFVRKDGNCFHHDGIKFLRENTTDLGYTVIPVDVDKGTRHLTTGASFAGRLKDGNTILLNPNWVDPTPFEANGLKTLRIPPDDQREKWAANVLPLNGKVIVQADCPKTLAILQSAGAKLIEVPWDEFVAVEKAPCGHFTCCALQFPLES